MSNAILVVSFDFKGLLAALTGTRARAWMEDEGPESGCGLDYWYSHRKYKGGVYINVDQGLVKISDCATDEVLYEGMLAEDPNYKQFVTCK